MKCVGMVDSRTIAVFVFFFPESVLTEVDSTHMQAYRLKNTQQRTRSPTTSDTLVARGRCCDIRHGLCIQVRDTGQELPVQDNRQDAPRMKREIASPFLLRPIHTGVLLVIRDETAAGVVLSSILPPPRASTSTGCQQHDTPERKLSKAKL